MLIKNVDQHTINNDKKLEKIYKYCSIIRCIGVTDILETGLKKKKRRYFGSSNKWRIFFRKI